MPGISRRKGARIERELVRLHQDAGIAAAKVSRTGYPGQDLRIAETFSAEVKARANGDGFKQLQTWLGDADLLFLRRDRQQPLVVLSWSVYLTVLKGYLTHLRLAVQHGAEEAIGRSWEYTGGLASTSVHLAPVPAGNWPGCRPDCPRQIVGQIAPAPGTCQ